MPILFLHIFILFILTLIFLKHHQFSLWLSILFIYFLTLYPISELLTINHNPHPFNFQPFIDLKLGYANAGLEIVLNILLFVPLGYTLKKQFSFLKTLLIGCILSIIVEVLQYYFYPYRYGDITDILTNTIGILVGICLFYLLKKWLKPLD